MTLNGTHAFEETTVRTHRILFSCFSLLVDVDCVNGTLDFDADGGGFVSAIVTGYQSDFEWTCLFCNDTNEDKDDHCEDDDDEGNENSNALDLSLFSY